MLMAAGHEVEGRSLTEDDRAVLASQPFDAKLRRLSESETKWLIRSMVPLIKGGQRAAPVVVVPEGPAAGGGVWSSAVDPGVPLGPGLGGTRSVFHGPHVRIATARMNAKAIRPNVLFRS
jgi:hypothetical protein